MSNQPKQPPLSEMRERFTGDYGRELLLRVLEEESLLLRGVEGLSDFLNVCELVAVPAGRVLIEQGAADDDLYVVVSGHLDVQVNGRTVASRRPGAHVGEMAVVDATAKRMATVIAVESSVVLKCPGAQFTALANQQPKVWRRIGVELSRRLTERSAHLKPPRAQPTLFVGCSTEALAIARAVQTALKHDPIVVTLWTDGVFNASRTPIEDLTNTITEVDFGLLVISPDDKIISRKRGTFGARDNVVFELGLLIGAIGRDRTFLLHEIGVDVRLPTDLTGVTPIEYASGNARTLPSRIAAACNELRTRIIDLGPI